MLSTIDKDLICVDNVWKLIPKWYPNWYEIEDIGFIWHNEWSDSYIEYNRKQINSHIIEDVMWNRFCKEKFIGEDLYIEYGKYMYEHKEDIYELLDEYLKGEQT